MPSLSRGAVKVILRYISDRSDKGDDEARKLMPFLTKRAGIKKTWAEPSRKAVKKVKRETRREKVAFIRGVVIERSGGLCELATAWAHSGSELHHLEPGGRRRALESPSTCVWACAIHHWDYHRHPEAYRDIVTVWATKHHHPLPSRFRREPKETP